MNSWLLSFVTLMLALGLSFHKANVQPLSEDLLPARLPLKEIPLGLDARLVPKDNPLTETRVKLGRKLFFDPILSNDRTIACASCHLPQHGFASNGKPRGVSGQLLARRAPTLLNRTFGTSFFWDGRADSLEDQALLPITNVDEMGSSLKEVLHRLSADKAYQADFTDAFTDGVTSVNVGKAIASFERVLLRGASGVDQFRRLGRHDALSNEERHGLWLYESKARCWRCHSGGNFTDEQYHNTGVSWGKTPADPGRFTVTGNDADRNRFKTPTLRGVALTGPYMHDASMPTLKEVVHFYNRGGGADPRRDDALAPLDLAEDEVSALVAFLKAL